MSTSFLTIIMVVLRYP